MPTVTNTSRNQLTATINMFSMLNTCQLVPPVSIMNVSIHFVVCAKLKITKQTVNDKYAYSYSTTYYALKVESFPVSPVICTENFVFVGHIFGDFSLFSLAQQSDDRGRKAVSTVRPRTLSEWYLCCLPVKSVACRRSVTE